MINLNAPTRVCEAIDHSQIIAGEEEEKWKRTEEDWEEDFRRQLATFSEMLIIN